MAVGKSGKARTGKDENGGTISWQAQKSAMTRDKILDAAIDCFIHEGYTNVTTAKVANAAGVSRGAMLHHFPSKLELIQAAIEYLHDKLVEDFTGRVQAIPKNLRGKKHRRAGLDAYWEHLTSDLFMAYHELCVAGRMEPELREILDKSTLTFDQHVRNSTRELFKEWADRGDRFLLAMDVTKFMMEGMAVGQVVGDREARINRLLDYLADRLEEIFKEGGSGAIGRHSAGNK